MKVDLNITDFLKLPTKIMVSIALGTCLLLFLPNWLIEKLYMVEFREEFGFIIGIVFIISLTISIVSLSVALYNYQAERKTAKEFVETATQYAVAGLNNAVFPYFIQPWVVEKLNTDPTLLNSFYKAYQDISDL